MKKLSLFVGLFILCMTLSTNNLYAAACSPTRGKVEVSVTGAGVCTNIQTAIDLAALVATVSNPVVVSVLPGTYTVTVPITMKPYVDVVGSGRENTKITSSASSTVIGANNSTIENIWVDNAGAIEVWPTAILNDNTSMKINNIKVTMNSSNNGASGIRSRGSAKNVISNCDISVSGDMETLGIAAEGDEVTVLNCTIDIKATAPTNQWSTGIYASSNKVTVRDSVITSEGPRYNYAIYIGGHGYVTVSNTELKAISTENTTENKVIRGWESVVTGSKLIATGSAMNNCIGDGTSMIGGSLIQGTNCGNAKIVNSWNENYDPIQYP